MPLTKSRGNMYDWCSHMHTHLGGQCPHNCSYCSTADIGRRFRIKKYTGPLRLIEKEFKVNYGSGKTIFLEHCNDLFAEAVPSEFIWRVIFHAGCWPDNTYVFQTKNPERYFRVAFPDKSVLGCTIETNRVFSADSLAPWPILRAAHMAEISKSMNTFITIEPIMNFDPLEFLRMLTNIRPRFINIGADSKKHGLPEPSKEKVLALIAGLQRACIPINLKPNLARIIGKDAMQSCNPIAS